MRVSNDANRAKQTSKKCEASVRRKQRKTSKKCEASIRSKQSKGSITEMRNASATQSEQRKHREKRSVSTTRSSEQRKHRRDAKRRHEANRAKEASQKCETPVRRNQSKGNITEMRS